ncbi:MAG: hypothetical protein PHD82_14620 [Candidatus Riflebacteria bacterium]|nr:hypothetical protein [Candidatus Riflebacteria bacterium]
MTHVGEKLTLGLIGKISLSRQFTGPAGDFLKLGISFFKGCKGFADLFFGVFSAVDIDNDPIKPY